MLKNIYLKKYPHVQSAISVKCINVKRGQRIRSDQVLITLVNNAEHIDIKAQNNGWVRFVAVKEKQALSIGDLLLIIDSVDTSDYRLDDQEVNPQSELGQEGRRGAEREGQRKIGTHSGELFDAPEKSEGGMRQSVKQHPLLQNMKEGVPPKMANAKNNQPATDRFAEDAAGNDPKLQKQLSAQLQAQLNITPGPNVSPSLTRG
jgi:pyruvate/2-oxoglutarate dehydrogenase complex dihydrolipoamide acyltransferase (E2) component